MDSVGTYTAFLHIMSHEIAKPKYGLQNHAGNSLSFVAHDSWREALKCTDYTEQFDALDAVKADMILKGVLYEACEIMNWKCSSKFMLSKATVTEWVDGVIPKVQETVISHDDLIWMIDSTVLTIMNDRVSYDAARHALESRGFLPIPQVRDALIASGDGLYDKFMKLNKHPSHKVIMRHRIGMEVANQMDIDYRKKVSDNTILSLADVYRPKVDWSLIERKVGSHLTSSAFNAMTEVEQIKWLHGLYEPEITAQAPEEYAMDSDPTGLFAEAMKHMDNAAVHFEKVKAATSHITDPVNNSGTFKILGNSADKLIGDTIMNDMNDYTTPIEKREELVFGHALSKLSKTELMTVIRDAKTHAKSFDDLAGESTYADGEIAKVKAGIAKVLKVLDKK